MQVPAPEEGSVASTRLDYDTYMQHRRPGSTVPTEDTSKQDILSPSMDKVQLHVFCVFLWQLALLFHTSERTQGMNEVYDASSRQFRGKRVYLYT